MKFCSRGGAELELERSPALAERILRPEARDRHFSLDTEKYKSGVLHRLTRTSQSIGTLIHMASDFILSLSETLTPAISSDHASAIASNENTVAPHTRPVRDFIHWQIYRALIMINEKSQLRQSSGEPLQVPNILAFQGASVKEPRSHLLVSSSCSGDKSDE